MFATVIISILLAAAVAAAITVLYKGRKKGKPLCGCDCRNCARNSICKGEKS
ncbi:MAG TPA: FeoB-associated Cys-rich membrane protein [Bacillota bacterium]|nr:FeoB-associated Cys-rich membrane protein [Bacillota bacterium]HUM56168.1 FeoB-associated Cys-rich membrane protein [Bacillota bacterium]